MRIEGKTERERYKRRLMYFKNYRKVAKSIKALVKKFVNAEVFVFGSVIKGDFSVGLSDIDIAVVSEKFKNRELKLKIYDELLKKYFDSPFEFHILTPEQWRFYRRFIKKNEMIKVR